MSTNLIDLLLDQEEGPSSPTAYQVDGFWHIGRGVCIDSSVPGAGLPAAALQIANEAKVTDATFLAQRFPRWNEHNEARQAVLVSMIYQMGEGPLHWPNFNAALAKLDYDAASAAGLDSKWAMVQTPKRAEREMAILKSGVWQ